MTITVLTKRIFNNTRYYVGKDYVKLIHKQVKQQPGFINGHSYWGSNNNIYTISHWKQTSDLWDWVGSTQREEITKKFRDEIISEEHETLSEIIYTQNDVFLL